MAAHQDGDALSARMPVVFIGHGSPMNAVADNAFTRMLGRLGRELPRPKAVLCVSAHWMSEGTWVTGMRQPRTIHDFYGFPEELFRIQYPSPGDPELAARLCAEVEDPGIHVDREMWGLDHGTWSVLRHLCCFTSSAPPGPRSGPASSMRRSRTAPSR